jgi:ferric-dicitrate binding protein FerR (iron transport regulator)
VPSVDGVIKEIAWKENKLVFEDEEFDAIAILLERWYAVKINFKDNEVRKYRFTGMFEKEKLETVLEFLKESRNFNYFIESGESITVNLLK